MNSGTVRSSDLSSSEALAQWDNEGGAGPTGPQETATQHRLLTDDTKSIKVELAQLHSRIIALETLLVSLLTDATDRQVAHVRTLAALITPRSDSTQHRLTIQASNQMCSLVERAEQIRSKVLA